MQYVISEIILLSVAFLILDIIMHIIILNAILIKQSIKIILTL